MKLNYHPETDSLYIDLSEETSVETREISDGVQLDYDAKGNLVALTSTMQAPRSNSKSSSSASFRAKSAPLRLNMAPHTDVRHETGARRWALRWVAISSRG